MLTCWSSTLLPFVSRAVWWRGEMKLSFWWGGEELLPALARRGPLNLADANSRFQSVRIQPGQSGQSNSSLTFLPSRLTQHFTQLSPHLVSTQNCRSECKYKSNENTNWILFQNYILLYVGFRLKICFRMLESKNKKYHSIRIEVSLDEIVFTLNR